MAILVLELRKKSVSSLPDLVREWRRNPAYLKGSVELWVKVGSKRAFGKVWSNAIKTAVVALAADAGRGGGGSKGSTGTEASRAPVEGKEEIAAAATAPRKRAKT